MTPRSSACWRWPARDSPTPDWPRPPRRGDSPAPTNAGHVAALAALRWHGYRSEHRFTVFQCLEHTVSWPSARWRVLDAAHQKRNLAEYEGELDVEESAIAELCDLVATLVADVGKLIEPSGRR